MPTFYLYGFISLLVVLLCSIEWMYSKNGQLVSTVNIIFGVLMQFLVLERNNLHKNRHIVANDYLLLRLRYSKLSHSKFYSIN